MVSVALLWGDILLIEVESHVYFSRLMIVHEQ